MTHRRPAATAVVISFPDSPRKRALIRNQYRRDAAQEARALALQLGWQPVPQCARALLAHYLQLAPDARGLLDQVARQLRGFAPYYGAAD